MAFNNKLSIYIPRIANKCFKKQAGLSFNNMTDFVKHMFHSLDIGRVKRVELAPIYSKNGSPSNFSNGFVHFDTWYYTLTAFNIQEKMQDKTGGGIAKLVYDDPHYWILKHNTSTAQTDRNEVSALKAQISDMNTRLAIYHTMLSLAQHQLGSLQGLITSEHAYGTDPGQGPVKRRRQIPLVKSHED
jgi:hypothetical protein